jgi:hypothetical protein
MSSVVLARACPRMRLTCTHVESDVDDQMACEGAAQVVREQTRAVAAESCAASGVLKPAPRVALVIGVPWRVVNTQSLGAVNWEDSSCSPSSLTSCGASGICRAAAAVFGATRRAGLPWLARESCART